MKTIFRLIAVCSVFAAASAFATVRVPAIFADNMVLQRDMPLPVWGTAAPGEKVTVTFAGQTRETTAGADGRWSLTLDKLATGKTPRDFVITGENTLRFTNVLVGEVWLCSGQSNMEWRMERTANATKDIAESAHPLIRLLHVQKSWSSAPRNNVELTAPWSVCSPETTPQFSAVAYFFGRELLNAFNNEVPIGLINASWGGARIEPWISPFGFAAVPALASINDRVQAATPGTSVNQRLTKQFLDEQSAWLTAARQAAAANKTLPTQPALPEALAPFNQGTGKRPSDPTVMYNAMIAPLAPYAIRGAIWYQGEANRPDGALYQQKLDALIASWRHEFQNPQLPLYIAQIAPYDYGSSTNTTPRLWVAQERFAKNDKYAGIAILNDVGNLKDIHPTDKLTVGKRLSLHALNKTYGRADVKCESPSPYKITFITDKKPTALIIYDHAEKLVTRDGRAPDWFEIAGPDGVFQKATAQIDKESHEGRPAIIVSAPGVKNPVAVRFAWSGIAEPNLRNEAGLQAGAFTYGDIPKAANTLTDIPEADGFELVYEINPLSSTGHEVTYKTDNSKKLADKKIERVAYYLQTIDQNGNKSHAFVAMDPFTDDLKKIGVPTNNSGARFQQKVTNLVINSNVRGVKTGEFKEGNIEFWDCNYSAANASAIPGASDATLDFGDRMNTQKSPGYGSMQIHNTAAKQTIIAYNHWSVGENCDIGIGNHPGKHPDWSFTKSGASLKSARLLVLIKTE